MYASVAHVPFKRPGILQCGAYQRVGAFEFGLELGHVFIAVCQRRFQLLAVLHRHMGRDELCKAVGLGYRQLFDARHILDGALGSHGAVCYDVGYIWLAVFFGYVFEYLAAPVVIEIHVNIREGDTVGIKETFKQQVVFQRVNLCDAQAVGHHRAGGRTTAGADGDAQFLAPDADEVLHDEEVARETHGLHDVQFEVYSVGDFFGKRGGVALLGPFIGEFAQVVGLELDAVELLISAEFLDFGLGVGLRHHHVAFFVSGELVEKVFVGEALAVFLLCAELLGDGIVRHDWPVVYRICLDFGDDFERVLDNLGHVGEKLAHFIGGLEPLLFCVEHAFLIVEVGFGRDADEMVVGLGVLLVDEVGVV